MGKKIRRRCPPSAPTAGTSSLELLLALAVLTTGLLAFSRTLVDSAELEEVNEETAFAVAGARRVAESLHATAFDEVFRAFNSSQADDAGLLSPAWGSGFAVEGLTPVDGDPDGLCGEVLLPAVDDGFGNLQLREDLVDQRLGMPRDLDLDGAIDALDHSADYRVLPVLVRVRWVGGGREQTYDLLTLVGAR